MHFSHTSLLAGLLAVGRVSCDSICSKLNSTHRPRLSSTATVQCTGQDVRWSEYAAPNPGAIVTVGSEDDVAALVAFANQNNIEFLLQSGGNGWADTFSIEPDDFIIDISRLKAISFNTARTEVHFQAGVLIKDLVDAAYAHDARVSTGTCNCVSVLGAALGGGLGRGQGLYGLGVDQLLSITYVNPFGQKATITAQSSPDLWFALAGAAPNFGIVTSVTFKSYPVPRAQNTAWTGSLVYSDTQLEALMSAIDALVLEPEMQLDFTYNSGAIIAIPFYIGSEAVGRQKFKSLLDIGPVAATTAVIPYDTWNSAGDAFCIDGGRKPTYGNNIQTVSPTAWRSIFTEYISFIGKYPEANATTILAECYPATVANVKPSASSFPWRGFKCYVATIAWYTSESLDEPANQFGRKVRNYLTSSSGTSKFSSYINFAHGDESLSSIYGSSLGKLQVLKRKYDPFKRFNQWFPLS